MLHPLDVRNVAFSKISVPRFSAKILQCAQMGRKSYKILSIGED